MNHDPMAFDEWTARWRHRTHYTVLDLRRDARAHFLHAWQTWRDDLPNDRCATLHFVAVASDWESDPRDGGIRRIVDGGVPTDWPVDIDNDVDVPTVTDARHESSTDGGAPIGALGAGRHTEREAELRPALDAAWPARVPGVHRIEFEEGRVVLTLAFSSVSDALANLWLRADDMYVDGATMHSSEATTGIAKGLARLAGPQSHLFLDSVSLDVDQAFQHSGFVSGDATVQLIDSGDSAPAKDHRVLDSTSRIRTMRFAPRWRVRRHEPPAPQIESRSLADANADADSLLSAKRLNLDCTNHHHDVLTDVLIIGAGLAGCALAQRLGARGLRIALIDAAPTIASGASGNPAGVFHPVVASDDSLASRATRAGFLYALRHWRSLERRGFSFDWSSQGLIQVAVDADEQASFESAIESFDLPRDLVRYVDDHEAQAFLGVRPAFGGLLFEHGGSVDPASLCRAQLEAAQASTTLDLMLNRSVASLEHDAHEWRALDTQGRCMARASIVVVANSNDASRLAGLDYAPTRAIRGQLSWIDDPSLAALKHPLIGDGYLLPRLGHATQQLTGASYELDDEDTALRESSQLDNLARLQRLVPDAAASLLARSHSLPLEGRVALRCATSDRMPMIGQLADESAARSNAAALSGAWPLDLPRRPGLYGAYGYGSRGLIWAALGAEIVASQITGEPLPVPRSIADAFDPARFLMRALRQREVR